MEYRYGMSTKRHPNTGDVAVNLLINLNNLNQNLNNLVGSLANVPT